MESNINIKSVKDEIFNLLTQKLPYEEKMNLLSDTGGSFVQIAIIC